MLSKLRRKIKGFDFTDWVFFFIAAGMAINTVRGRHLAAILNAVMLIVLFLGEINVVLHKILLELMWFRKKS